VPQAFRSIVGLAHVSNFAIFACAPTATPHAHTRSSPVHAEDPFDLRHLPVHAGELSRDDARTWLLNIAL